MLGVFGGAALAGSLAFSAVGHRLPRRLTFVTCFVSWAVAYVVLSTLLSLPLTLVVLALGGLALGPINPLLVTLSYELVPAHLRGRVFGAAISGSWAAIPAGVLIGGAVVEAAGVSATLLGIGVCYLAVTLFGFVNPAFREMDRRPEPAIETAS